MHLLLYIIITLLILALLLVLAALFLPLRYTFEASSEQEPAALNFFIGNSLYKLEAAYKNGELDWYLILLGWKKAPKKKPSSKNPARPANRSGAKKNTRHRENVSWRHAWGLLKTLWPIIRPNKLIINGRIGFEEPHYTGWLMGLAGIIQKQNNTYRIHLEGVWDEPCLEGQVMLAGKVWPVKFIGQLLKFLILQRGLKRWSARKRLFPSTDF